MKILNINTSLGLGGTERAAVNYAVGYKQLGHDSRFLVIYGGEDRKGRLIKNNVILYQYANNEIVLDELIRWEPEVLHFHRSNEIDSQIKTIIDFFKRQKKVLVVETNVFSRYHYSKWYKENVDISLQLSQWCLWKYNRWKGSTAKPLSAYGPYAVDDQNFYKENSLAVEGFRRKHGIDKGTFVIGRLGQPLDSKWHPEIITFFQKACSQYANLVLFLVGPSPSVVNKLNDLPMEIKAKIKIIKRIEGDDHLRLYYSSLDIFLHYSNIGESFGYVLTEAMMCGVPVITWSTLLKDNSQVEVVGNQMGGLVVNNEKSLREAFELLYEHPEVRLKIAEGLRDWVLNRFDAKKLCAYFIDLFSKTGTGGDKTFHTKNITPWQLLFRNNLRYPLVSKISLLLIHHPMLYFLYQKYARRIRRNS